MDPIGLDELTELCAWVAEARRRWGFSEADLHAPPPAIDEPIEVALRRLRQIGSSAILWRDVNSRNDIETTGRELARLAETCLQRALAQAEVRVAQRFGELTDDDGRPIRLIVLGLGKLGGEELNFNSDIDLIFAFSGQSQARGARHLPAREYLTFVARELVAIMDPVTEHGRVWATDTRLRPFGGAGALVWSAGAIEQYYLTEGRTWERYALIKARPVAGDLAAGERLLEDLRPFVYRRYLDFGIFDALRRMQREIQQAARRAGRSRDIKRGAGGIREAEFIVQSLQLLRGGRHARLRTPGFLPALAACRELALMDAQEAERLARHYRFLRVLENRLQAMTGRQTHDLPTEPAARARLARLMAYPDWTRLQLAVDEHTAGINTAFAQRFREPAAVDRDLPAWPPAGGEAMAESVARAGFDDASRAACLLTETAERLAGKPISAAGRARLDALMPKLIAEAGRTAVSDAAFADLLRLIEAIARRSAYLSLLTERPEVLRRLVRVFTDSARVAQWIIASPQLLDDLLDPVHGHGLNDLAVAAGDDLEYTLAALGRFRQTGFLRTALGELDGQLDTPTARAQLSTLAQRIVEHALALTDGAGNRFAVIAYGNFGAGEMHYGSDLDLVFLYQGGQSSPLRAVQRLINLLTVPGLAGRLYEIDTRLRPNGRAGFLVSTLASFSDYQKTQAWVWEHQALVRARWVAGDESIKMGFDTVRAQVLGHARDRAGTAGQLLEMRQRQRRERSETPIRGLMTDVQFLVELGVLTQAAHTPQLLQTRATAELIGLLGACGWLQTDEAAALIRLWHAAGHARHQGYLKRQAPELDPALETECRRLFDHVVKRYA